MMKQKRGHDSQIVWAKENQSEPFVGQAKDV